MKNIILTGATGMIGGLILRKALAHPEISKVTSISRRSTGITDNKLVEVIHEDFSDYSGLETHFKNQDAAYFCLGAYTGQVPDDLFKKITFDFAKVFADALKAESPQATFCLLSGQGADPKEKSRISFARYKGMAENYLIAQDFGALHIFRPGYIYPVEKRKEPNFSYRLMRRLYPLMKLIFAKGVITSEELASSMFKAGMEGTDKIILENQEIKERI